MISSTSAYYEAAYIVLGVAILWCIAAGIGLFVVRMLERMKGRFSLREVFVDMTLAAVLLGAIGWFFS